MSFWRIVGWRVSSSMCAEPTLHALVQALWAHRMKGEPIRHSHWGLAVREHSLQRAALGGGDRSIGGFRRRCLPQRHDRDRDRVLPPEGERVYSAGQHGLAAGAGLTHQSLRQTRGGPVKEFPDRCAWVQRDARPSERLQWGCPQRTRRRWWRGGLGGLDVHRQSPPDQRLGWLPDPLTLCGMRRVQISRSRDSRLRRKME